MKFACSISFYKGHPHHEAVWVKLGYLLYFCTQEFGAEALNAVAAARNVLTVKEHAPNTWWPDVRMLSKAYKLCCCQAAERN